MKKILFLCAIIISSSILSSCSPIVQGAAAVTTVATMNNDRRTMGEILDDKTLFNELILFIFSSLILITPFFKMFLELL